MRGFCDFCGKSIAAKRYVKYCSDACKMKAYRRRKDELVGSSVRNHERIKNAVMTKHDTTVKSVCEQCGLEYWRTGTQGLQMYCSDACKQKAYRARKKEVVTAWSVGDECLTDTGRNAVIKDIRGTRDAVINELIGGQWLRRHISLNKLRPLVTQGAPVSAPAAPSDRGVRYGDDVEINKPGDFNHGRLGTVRPSLRGYEDRIPTTHRWVEFVSDHPDGGVYSGHYDVSEMIIHKTQEQKDEAYDKLMKNFGWIK